MSKPNDAVLMTFDPAPAGGPQAEDGGMEVDQNGFEVLPRGECLRLLRSAHVGRLAVTSDALPTVQPVDFAVHGEDILFVTGRGTKLDTATRDTVVAFEADDIDHTRRTGWSVVVTGIAREVTDPRVLAQASVRDLPRWVHDGDARVVAVSTELVSGRRIVPRIPPALEVVE